MPIEFIGSLVNAASALATDPEYPARMAAVHEESGFDRLLVGDSSSSPDGFSVASQVLTTTSRLAVLLAHRPGLVAPTVAARQFATLEAFHPGRVALQVITDGDDADQRRDGDTCDKAARYRRSDEFLQVVKLAWSSPEPFHHAGEFYRVADGWSAVRPRGGRLPVYFAGVPDHAVRVAGRHADVCAVESEPPAAIAGRIAAVRAAASSYGRSPRFSVTLRPVAAATEVGRYERVVEALLDYVALGVSTLLIRGYDPEAGAADYAAIIRLVRERTDGNRCLVA